jgi:hypothetical protein
MIAFAKSYLILGIIVSTVSLAKISKPVTAKDWFNGFLQLCMMTITWYPGTIYFLLRGDNVEGKD